MRINPIPITIVDESNTVRHNELHDTKEGKDKDNDKVKNEVIGPTIE